MGYLVLKVAIALFLVMNGPGSVVFTGAQESLAQQAYNAAKELADKAAYVLNRVIGLAFFTHPYEKCINSFSLISVRANVTEELLRDLSGDKDKAKEAAGALEGIKQEPHTCENLLKEVPWQRGLVSQVAGDAQTLVELIESTYDLATSLSNQAPA